MDDRSSHSTRSSGHPSGSPSSRSGRRKRKRVRNSPRQLQERFTWEKETKEDKAQRSRHRWGLILFGSAFLLLFLGLVYVASLYYKQALKTSPHATPIKQKYQELPHEPKDVSEDLR